MSAGAQNDYAWRRRKRESARDKFKFEISVSCSSSSSSSSSMSFFLFFYITTNVSELVERRLAVDNFDAQTTHITMIQKSKQYDN